MAVERVGDMSIEELQRIVSEWIEQKLMEHDRTPLNRLPRPADPLTSAQVRESIENNRIVLPPGARSNQELLREDRDR
jgi:hypothetical protein